METLAMYAYSLRVYFSRIMVNRLEEPRWDFSAFGEKWILHSMSDCSNVLYLHYISVTWIPPAKLKEKHLELLHTRNYSPELCYTWRSRTATGLRTRRTIADFSSLRVCPIPFRIISTRSRHSGEFTAVLCRVKGSIKAPRAVAAFVRPASNPRSLL